MRTIIIIIASLFVYANAISQQNAQYSQYLFNQLVINPAYAGAKGMVNVNGIYSSQWSGLDGAPTTVSLSIEGPLYTSMGAGLHVVQDEIGAQTQTSVYGSYAYKVRLSQNWRLSMGLAAGVSYFSINGEKFSSFDENLNDPSIPLTREVASRFDTKAGLFIFSKKFYAGFSVSDLTANVKSPEDLLVTGQVQHFYLTAGYVFKINDNFKFKPGFLIKEDFRAMTNVDLNAYFLFKDRFWLGATVRTGADIFNNPDLDNSLRYRDALVLMADVNITDNFRIGYSYTYSMTALSNFAGHEVLLGYYFAKKPKTKMLTPRFF